MRLFFYEEYQPLSAWPHTLFGVAIDCMKTKPQHGTVAQICRFEQCNEGIDDDTNLHFSTYDRDGRRHFLASTNDCVDDDARPGASWKIRQIGLGAHLYLDCTAGTLSFCHLEEIDDGRIAEGLFDVVRIPITHSLLAASLPIKRYLRYGSHSFCTRFDWLTSS